MWAKSEVLINTRHFPKTQFLNYMCFWLLGILDVALDFLWHYDPQKRRFRVYREGYSEDTPAQQ